MEFKEGFRCLAGTGVAEGTVDQRTCSKYW